MCVLTCWEPATDSWIDILHECSQSAALSVSVLLCWPARNIPMALGCPKLVTVLGVLCPNTLHPLSLELAHT